MRYFYLIFIIFSIQLQAQERLSIQGQVNVPKDESASMIEVVNLSSKTGTLTDANGQFEIRVAEGDRLRIDALQYEAFTAIIDRGIMKSKQIIITIKYGINELEEIVVKPYDLEGNIAVDLERVNTYAVETNIPSTREILQSYKGENPTSPNLTVDENPTETRIVKNGLNVANIIRAIAKDRLKKKKGNNQIDSRYLKQLYEDGFFEEQLGLKRDQVYAFVEFAVNDKDFSKKLLKKENELDLIRYLMLKADEFKE